MHTTNEPPLWQMNETEPTRKRRWPILAGFGVALALVAVGGYMLAAQRSNSAVQSAADVPAGPEVTEATVAATDDTDSDTAGDPLSDAESDPLSDTAGDTRNEEAERGAAEGVDGVVVDDGRPEGYEGDAPFAIFNGGILTLYGKVSNQEVYDRYEERFGNIVGPENVVNKYTIDPDFVLDEGQTTPVYVTDAVLFDFNSIALKPEYLYLLDYGALMLQQNPQATLTIVTYTDAVGSAEVNMKVARLRAQEVLDYWIREGVNPDQVLSDPRGEDGASEDDDEATAATRRRAEFVITGLLD